MMTPTMLLADATKHPVLNNMVSGRHNAAVHILVDDIHKAHHESPWHLIVHAGVKYNEHAPPGSKLPSTTIPQWALPSCTECPDVVLLLGWDETMPIPSDNSLVEFVIADLTYCRGDCSLAAISRKQNKYDHGTPRCPPSPGSRLGSGPSWRGGGRHTPRWRGTGAPASLVRRRSEATWAGDCDSSNSRDQSSTPLWYLRSQSKYFACSS